MKDLKFILVDDNHEFRQGLKALLETEFSAKVIAEASNGKEFLELSNHRLADIIIMDLMMPEKDGIAATKPFIWKSPYAKVIAVTMHNDNAYLQQLIEAGFKGCIFKNNIFTEIKIAVETVMSGQFYFSENIKIA
jgi:DNA-binding NarL/FixJ family response regulator